MFCRKCGSDIGDAKFCPSCGADQTEGLNQQYGVNNGQQYYQQPVTTDMTVGEWIIALILSIIPIIGIVFLIIWAVGKGDSKPSRKNWAIAQLVIVAAVTIIAIIFVFALAATGK